MNNLHLLNLMFLLCYVSTLPFLSQQRRSYISRKPNHDLDEQEFLSINKKLHDFFETADDEDEVNIGFRKSKKVAHHKGKGVSGKGRGVVQVHQYEWNNHPRGPPYGPPYPPPGRPPIRPPVKPPAKPTEAPDDSDSDEAEYPGRYGRKREIKYKKQ